VTVETCAHYLAFAAEDIPDGATQYKCAPPLRDAHHRELLWKSLLVSNSLLLLMFILGSGFVSSV
jgi:dihydroorotase-like cyclic amidohydrolase